jgi:hypothetical protein
MVDSLQAPATLRHHSQIKMGRCSALQNSDMLVEATGGSGEQGGAETIAKTAGNKGLE